MAFEVPLGNVVSSMVPGGVPVAAGCCGCCPCPCASCSNGVAAVTG